MAGQDLRKDAEVDERGAADFETVGSAAAFAVDVEAEFAFGVFGSEIDFAGRCFNAFGMEDEVVDEFLHLCQHGSLRRWVVFWVVDEPVAAGHFVADLADDADALFDFFDSDEVAVVAIADAADGDVEVVLFVTEVGLLFAKVVVHAAGAEVRAAEPVGDGVFFGDEADVFGAVHKDAIAGEKAVGFIDDREDFVAEFADCIQEAVGEVADHSADAGPARCEAGAGHLFHEVVDDFALLESVQKDRHRAGIHGEASEAEKVRGDAGEFAAEDAHGLSTRREFPAHELFNSHGVGDVIGDGGQIVEPVRVGDELVVGHVLGDFFVAAMEEADIGSGFCDHFSIEFQDESENAVGRGMGRAHVNDELFAQCVAVALETLLGLGQSVGHFKFNSASGHR